MADKTDAPPTFPVNDLALPPLQVEAREVEPNVNGRRGESLDALVRIGWGGRSYSFGAEYQPRSNPRVFQKALSTVLEGTRGADLYPLLVLPYLSQERLRELSERGVSGIDLCGNGVVIVPDELFVFRSGAPNRFSTYSPIKNIYRKTSSLVARAFLLRPRYPGVNDIREEIESRGGRIAISTVSKVLKALEDDLVVGRERGVIRLLQPEKLLDRLVDNFEPPDISRSFRGGTSLSREELSSVVVDAAERRKVRLAAGGTGSTGRYAVMARDELLSLYCTDRDRLLSELPVTEDSFFPTVEILETRDETAYFDVRPQDGYPWASPLQTYLELMKGEKRSRETAEQVRALILRELEEKHNL